MCYLSILRLPKYSLKVVTINKQRINENSASMDNLMECICNFFANTDHPDPRKQHTWSET